MNRAKWKESNNNNRQTSALCSLWLVKCDSHFFFYSSLNAFNESKWKSAFCFKLRRYSFVWNSAQNGTLIVCSHSQYTTSCYRIDTSCFWRHFFARCSHVVSKITFDSRVMLLHFDWCLFNEFTSNELFMFLHQTNRGKKIQFDIGGKNCETLRLESIWVRFVQYGRFDCETL